MNCRKESVWLLYCDNEIIFLRKFQSATNSAKLMSQLLQRYSILLGFLEILEKHA